MRILSESFIAKGHRHQLIARSEHDNGCRCAVYKRWAISTEPNQTEHFEVIKIHVDKQSDWIIDGQTIHYEGGERYPSEREWGTMGWAYQSITLAMEKFRTLAEKTC